MNNKKFILLVGILLFSSTTVAGLNTTHATYNWSGAYVGGFIGGAASTQVTATEPLRLDNNTYWFRPFHSSFSYNSSSTFIGGGAIGYSLQIGNTPYLMSLEGEYGYLNVNGRSKDPNQLPYSALPNQNIHNNASLNSVNIGGSYGYAMVGGRIGYVQGRSLFYVKSGAVFTSIESKYSSEKTDSSSSTGIAFLHNYGANSINGYGVGGGMEYALPFKGFSNISAKIEYLYFGIAHTQLAYGHCSCNFLWLMTERFRGIHTAKFGINYKLG
jgi:hypothetical protein